MNALSAEIVVLHIETIKKGQSITLNTWRYWFEDNNALLVDNNGNELDPQDPFNIDPYDLVLLHEKTIATEEMYVIWIECPVGIYDGYNTFLALEFENIGWRDWVSGHEQTIIKFALSFGDNIRNAHDCVVIRYHVITDRTGDWEHGYKDEFYPTFESIYALKTNMLVEMGNPS